MFAHGADPSRPLRVLLVSDDDAFADELAALALDGGGELGRAAPHEDLELAAYRHGANVVAVDVDAALRRRIRTATAFAAAHPGVTIVLLASEPGEAVFAGLPVVAKLSAGTVLPQLDRARAGDLAFKS